MKKNNQKFVGKIRIIGGQWRGHKLPVLNSSGLRPTTDRIRETLFNWLSSKIIGAHCLDCFAGSGGLGFEALSRNAKHVTFLEIKRNLVFQLQKNSIILKSNNIQVIRANALIFLSKPNIQQYNIVFIDPPFRKGLLPETLKLLEKNNWLSVNAWIHVESEIENKSITVPTNWKLYREMLAGQVACRLYHLTK